MDTEALIDSQICPLAVHGKIKNIEGRVEMCLPTPKKWIFNDGISGTLEDIFEYGFNDYFVFCLPNIQGQD